MINTEHAYLFVGSYTNKDSNGINCFQFNTENGTMEHLYSVDGIENPSYLAVDAKHQFLYAVSEKMDGTVVSYSIDPTTTKLSKVNEQPTLGAAPCYLTINREEDCLLVVNYSGGSVCTFPIDNGKIGNMTGFVQHEGSGIRLDRQEGPHPHSVLLNETGQIAYVPDLGLDQIVMYKLDPEACKLVLHDKVDTHPGAGPRHLAFHPDKPYAYVINELDSTIITFACDSFGQLTPIQTVQTLPDGFEGNSTSADIHITPSGKFLYGSNRGHDSLAIYKINPENGKLTHEGYTSTRGKTPRNFCLSPDGKYLITANQESDSIVTFKINQETGQLSEPINITTVSEPVCIKFL